MILTAFIAPLAGFFGATVLGLGIWRYQLIAQRKYQVAEEALTAAEQAVTDIYAIRRAVLDARHNGERYPESIPVQPWAATNFRLQSAAQNFENFGNAMKSVAMHFGDTAALPFRELDEIHSSISDAQTGMYFRNSAEKVYPTTETIRQLEEWKRTVEDQGENDPINREVNKCHQAIRRKLGKHLRPNVLRLFLPLWD